MSQKETINPFDTRGTPDELMAAFEAGIRGTADIDMHEILHDVIADVLNSVRLAMESAGIDKGKVSDVLTTVGDYVVNHYGDE